jgi:hypothetical protein
VSSSVVASFFSRFLLPLPPLPQVEKRNNADGSVTEITTIRKTLADGSVETTTKTRTTGVPVNDVQSELKQVRAPPGASAESAGRRGVKTLRFVWCVCLPRATQRER